MRQISHPQHGTKLPDFYVREIQRVRNILSTYRGTRFRVIFAYELFWAERCFQNALIEGSRYWAEIGLQTAERIVADAWQYPKALDEAVEVPRAAIFWMKVMRLLMWRTKRMKAVPAH